jgi:lipopolysaccharide/colanic/teichoic acid biosynthesis glycosyltransferase
MSVINAQQRGTALLPHRRPITHVLKRTMDIIGALVLCFILSPLFLIIGMFIALDGGPIFYRHCRVGRNGVSFGCLKF